MRNDLFVLSVLENGVGSLAAFGTVSIVLLLIFIPLFIACYVLCAKGIKRILCMYGYEKTWMAWVPFLQYYSLADAAFGKNENCQFLSWNIPTFIFKFWWIVSLVCSFVSIPAGSYVVLITQIVCLGTVFAHIFAAAENKTYKEMEITGLVAGWLPIIAIVKFYSYDKNVRLSSLENS